MERFWAQPRPDLVVSLLPHYNRALKELAEGDMFRTTPLWGIGKRLFFLHDGRTSDLLQAIPPVVVQPRICRLMGTRFER